MYELKELTRDISLGEWDEGRVRAEKVTPAQVVQIKSTAPKLLRSIAAPVVRAEGADGDRPEDLVVVYNATVEVIDRMGDLILTKPRRNFGRFTEEGEWIEHYGWQTENVMAAGAPFLWSHLSREPAIGRIISTAPAKIETPHDGRVWATQQGVRYFNDERIPYSVAAWVLHAEYDTGTAVSVGFSAPDVWWPRDDELRKKIGLGSWGVVFLTSDQTELSRAQTPANQLALVVRRLSDLPDAERRRARAHEAGRRKFLERQVGRTIAGVKITDALLRDFVKAYPLSGLAEREAIVERAEGFFDLGRAAEVAEVYEVDGASDVVRDADGEPVGEVGTGPAFHVERAEDGEERAEEEPEADQGAEREMASGARGKTEVEPVSATLRGVARQDGTVEVTTVTCGDAAFQEGAHQRPPAVASTAEGFLVRIQGENLESSYDGGKTWSATVLAPPPEERAADGSAAHPPRLSAADIADAREVFDCLARAIERQADFMERQEPLDTGSRSLEDPTTRPDEVRSATTREERSAAPDGGAGGVGGAGSHPLARADEAEFGRDGDVTLEELFQSPSA